MKILILAAGPADTAADGDAYPALLAEEQGMLLVERTVERCQTIAGTQLIFAVRDEDIRRHHLDKVIQLVAKEAVVVPVSGTTAGAACTALLAIEHIADDDELLILNGNEIVDVDFAAVTRAFREARWDGGVVTFPSVHPRYSYVRKDADGLVQQAAEKEPISRHATAGFYWYRRGSDFVRAAQAMIRKGDTVGGLYYICPAFNQMVLRQARIGTYLIQAGQYRPVKSRRQRELLEEAALRGGHV